MTLRRRSSAVLLVVLSIAVLAVVVLTTLVPTSGAAPSSKISARVLKETAHGNATEALVVLTQQADLAAAGSLPTKAAKGRYVVNALRDVASRTQAPIIALLEKRGTPYQSFWLVNMIQVTGNRALMDELAARADVKQIDANPHVRTDLPIPTAVDAPDQANGIEWNVMKVKAQKVWALGFKGQGRVVAGADTGVQWDHPALKGHYRGWNGNVANHDYNWHDATAAHSPTPVDPHSHGTFTVSQMVGDDGHGNQVGVAPGAQWIACRNMDPSGTGSPTTYTECFQFLIAPYPVGGNPNQGDPTKAPDSINNSWGCPPSEGCSANTLMQIVNNVRAAGIFPAVAAGNSGPSCSSITDPPALYDSSVTVGATDSLNHIAGFSSRGPVTVDGSNRRKPDISAPGVNIRGAVPTNAYASGWSGTSMATPHIAGSVALLWQAKPSLIGNIDATELLLEKKSVHIKTVETCGGTAGKVPNNVFGYGVLNIYRAVIAP
ncbi:MAG: S8 family serine peptidase [Terriglobales bacterium]